MSKPVYGGARHLSIVWAVTLAILTLMEWRQLEQDPLNRQILSPFIQRQVTVHVGHSETMVDDFDRESEGQNDESIKTRYEVAFHFNGPLFLLCFFGPVLAFHALALFWQRLRSD